VPGKTAASDGDGFWSEHNANAILHCDDGSTTDY
jgi:hypothetical protein